MADIVNEDLLLRVSGAYDLELVKRLDLSGRSLSSIQGIEACINLVELNISQNQISDLSPVCALENLQRLDASNNCVRSLPPALGSLSEVTHLRLESNVISSMDELRVLSSLGKLRNLYFQNKKQGTNEAADEKVEAERRDGNPVCTHPAYTTTLLRYVPELVVLDGERIKLRESSQKAMLAAMAVPAEKLQIPEKHRWLEGYSWESDKTSSTTQERTGSRGSKSRRADRKGHHGKSTAPGIFDEDFIQKATAVETTSFEAAVINSDQLDKEAETLLETAASVSM